MAASGGHMIQEGFVGRQGLYHKSVFVAVIGFSRERARIKYFGFNLLVYLGHLTDGLSHLSKTLQKPCAPLIPTFLQVHRMPMISGFQSGVYIKQI